jgi:cell division inhibitor SepF
MAFGKKKNETPETTLKAIEKLIMEQLTDNDNKAAEFVDSLKEGSPLIINFEALEPVAANKMLAFFAGACYALDGRSVKINEKTYLFARRVDFFDGSIQKFIDSLPKA